MISIQTNVASLYGQQNFQSNAAAETKTIQQLTSGFRINSSADDAAGLAIANSLRSQGVELTQGVQNATNAVSQLQIIDGGLNNISQILDNLKQLATQAASDTFTGDFNTLNNQFQSDLKEINRQAGNVGLDTAGDYNKSLSIYVGGGIGNNNGDSMGTASETVDLSGATSSVDAFSLGLATGTAAAPVNLTITTAALATTAIAAISTAVTSLGKVQGVVGGGENQLNFAISLAQSQITNFAADQGQIRDADIASLASQMTKEQVLSQSSMAALSQANSMPQAVLKLLQ
jgi:flagellin